MTPKSEEELATIIKAATGPLSIRGGRTRDIGTPVEGASLSTESLSGISIYEPGALTLVAKAGTPLTEIEAALDTENQRLAFEPMDHRVLLKTKGTPTIGGVIATNASGSRRISVGACRDHMLGVRFVDGNGTIIKNGGRVMKNVTGYDLVKLLTGSYGTLGVLTEVSLKVLPKPETSATLILHDLDLQDSVSAMSLAIGSPFEVTGAAKAGTQTCIRIEGFESSVNERFKKLEARLGQFGEITRLDTIESEDLWRGITNVSAFSDHSAVTRVSLPPSAAPDFAQRVWQTYETDLSLDWGGGLMWFALSDDQVNSIAAQSGDVGVRTNEQACGQFHSALQEFTTSQGGHATLIKAQDTTRNKVNVFQPEAPVVATLSKQLRAKFDPRGILNPGLMT